MLESILALAIASVICMAALGVGVRIVDVVGMDRRERVLIASAMGFGVMSLVWLTLGALKLYSPLLAWALTILLVISTIKASIRWLGDFRKLLEGLAPADWVTWSFAIFVSVLMLAALTEALLPPVRYDSHLYHLLFPKHFIASGGIAFMPSNSIWGYSLGGEMLYTWAMLMGRAETATVLGWFLGILAVLGIGMLTARYGTRAAWVSMGSVLAGKSLWSSLGWGYVDWITAFYGIAIIASFHGWSKRRNSRWLVIAALQVGFAIGTKYSAGIAILAGLACLLLLQRGRRSLILGATFIAVTALTILPWLIKNAVATGAPMYPFLGESDWISASEQAFIRGRMNSAPLWQSLLLPLSASILGVEGAPGFSTSIGPLMAGLLLGVIWGRKKADGLIQVALIFVTTGFGIWALMSSQYEALASSRLYYVMFPAWAILAGFAYHSIPEVSWANVGLKRIAYGLVVASLGFSALNATIFILSEQTLPTLFGVQSKETYLRHRLGPYFSAIERIKALGKDATILMLWEGRGYLCYPGCIADARISRWYEISREYDTAEEILGMWREEGITHLLLNRVGLEFVKSDDHRFPPEAWDLLDSVLAAAPVYEEIEGVYTLFRVP